MSERPKDGGSAFPIPHDDRPGAYVAEPGMSLRDWFAGQALTGMLLASYRHDSLRRVPKGDLESVSQDAYDIADAMLEARSK